MDIRSGEESVSPASPASTGVKRAEAGMDLLPWFSWVRPVSPQLLVFRDILGQVLFPLNFNQLVQLHGGLGVFHRGMALPDLYVPV